MKLATLRDGTRDGTLIVVSRDLKHAVKADHVAPTLQDALDDWNYLSPLLREIDTADPIWIERIDAFFRQKHFL